jgi:transposase
MNHKTVHVGIDVSKENLDITPFDNKPVQIKNTSAGIRSLIERIKARPETIIVCCEASGGYEKLLCAMLLASGIEIACVNARRVRSFADSRGILAKTDAIDARVIAAFSEANRPRIIGSAPVWLEEMKALLIRREELMEMRKAEKSRLDPAPHHSVADLIREHILLLNSSVRDIENTLRRLVKKYDELTEKVSRLTSVHSFGMIAATSLLAYIPELGSVTDNQATALAGLAPYNRDSGTMKGKRRVHGGRARIRRALYMPAVGACHRNHVFKEVYERLESKGKPGKVALTAVMRKMVVLANRLMANPDFQIS